MAVLQDEEDDLPAVEVNFVAQANVPERLMRKDLKKGKHGPSIIRENKTVSSTYDATQRRLFVGMDQGEVLWWQLRSGSLSQEHVVGSHTVRATLPIIS